MNKKISVIIPTLQKNKELLINLLRTLSNDSEVDEIIVIDNSLKGIEENIEKTKEIIKIANAKGVSVEAEVGSIGGEWAVLGLARSGVEIPDDFLCLR